MQIERKRLQVELEVHQLWVDYFSRERHRRTNDAANARQVFGERLLKITTCFIIPPMLIEQTQDKLVALAKLGGQENLMRLREHFSKLFPKGLEQPLLDRQGLSWRPIFTGIDSLLKTKQCKARQEVKRIGMDGGKVRAASGGC